MELQEFTYEGVLETIYANKITIKDLSEATGIKKRALSNMLFCHSSFCKARIKNIFKVLLAVNILSQPYSVITICKTGDKREFYFDSESYEVVNKLCEKLCKASG